MDITRSRPATRSLYTLKPAFVRSLGGMEQPLARRGITADQLTITAVGVGGLTALALIGGAWFPLLWLGVAPLCLLRMACNALDGAMARRHGTATQRGAVLNELGDRAADTVTLAALGVVIGWPLALTVVVVALLVSFVAVAAQAVTGQRLSVGPMGKPDRVAVLSVGALAAAVVGPVALRVAAWALLLGGLVTLLRRVIVLWRVAGASA